VLATAFPVPLPSGRVQANSRKGTPPRHLDCLGGTDVDGGQGTSQVVLVGVYVIFAAEEE
jgi:hypothetical protein